jgi:hypothetical protein
VEKHRATAKKDSTSKSEWFRFSAMSNFAQKIQQAADADNPQKEAMFAAIRQLLAPMTPTEKAEFIKDLARENGIESLRSGPVLATVLRLIPKNQEFSAEEIRRGVDAAGVEATAKAVLNALNYLQKKQRIQRVGHGRYIVDGNFVVDPGELGGAPSRHEIDDT